MTMLQYDYIFEIEYRLNYFAGMTVMITKNAILYKIWKIHALTKTKLFQICLF